MLAGFELGARRGLLNGHALRNSIMRSGRGRGDRLRLGGNGLRRHDRGTLGCRTDRSDGSGRLDLGCQLGSRGLGRMDGLEGSRRSMRPGGGEPAAAVAAMAPVGASSAAASAQRARSAAKAATGCGSGPDAPPAITTVLLLLQAEPRPNDRARPASRNVFRRAARSGGRPAFPPRFRSAARHRGWKRAAALDGQNCASKPNRTVRGRSGVVCRP